MPTKVFISWSGDLSNKLADAIRHWLPSVIQFARPYFTPTDIEKGTKWSSEINAELANSDIGIICLTKENLEKPWILFEAGALSKNFDKSRVCTLLFDVETSELTGPLTIFQNTRFEKTEFKKLVKVINSAGGEAKLEDPVIDDVFEMWWPKLKEKVSVIIDTHKNASKSSKRSERDILEEILELTRLGTRRIERDRDLHPEVLMDLLESHAELALCSRRGDIKGLTVAIDRLDRPISYLCRAMPELAERHLRLRKRLMSLEDADEMLKKPA